MTWRSETDMREAYPELLADTGDPATLAVIRALDAGYNLHRPPPSIRSMPALRPRREVWDKLDKLGVVDDAVPIKPPWGIHTKLYAALSVVTAVVLLTAATVTTAGSGDHAISDLGTMTNALPPTNPAGEFERVKTGLHVGKLPEVLFIGTMVDEGSAGERWSLVKALDQFGTLSGLSANATRWCNDVSYVSQGRASRIVCSAPNAPPAGLPSFDLSHARYSSRYLALVAKDLIGHNLKLNLNLSETERSLLKRYVVFSNYGTWADDIWHTAVDYSDGSHRFPLLAIGNELATSANVAIWGDLSPQNSGSDSFTQVQESLRQGTPNSSKTSGPSPMLVQDYNAEANIITAFMCHADRMRPGRVCNRAVIRAVLKHIR